MSVWTDDSIDMLKRLFDEGLSFGQIAAELPGISRNACIGKAHRLKLARRKADARNHALASRPLPHLATKEAMKAKRVPGCSLNPLAGNILRKLEPAVVALPPETLPPRPLIALVDLTEHTCKWPIGHPREDAFGFCGAASEPSKPYCAEHVARAYRPREHS